MKDRPKTDHVRSPGACQGLLSVETSTGHASRKRNSWGLDLKSGNGSATTHESADVALNKAILAVAFAGVSFPNKFRTQHTMDSAPCPIRPSMNAHTSQWRSTSTSSLAINACRTMRQSHAGTVNSILTCVTFSFARLLETETNSWCVTGHILSASR